MILGGKTVTRRRSDFISFLNASLRAARRVFQSSGPGKDGIG
jgi:hypothetical protein